MSHQLSNMEENTVDSILEVLQTWAKEKRPIDAHQWLEGCAKLVVLLGDEQDKLFGLEQEIAQEKLRFIEEGDSVAKAKVRMEGRNIFVDARKLEAKIDRVTELVRISKLQARMSKDNMGNY